LTALSLGDHAITPPRIGSGVPQGANPIWEWGWPVRRGSGLSRSARSRSSSLPARRHIKINTFEITSNQKSHKWRRGELTA